jgi:hypothetical protein
MKTLLQMEMYYVREYTPTCRFLKIINSTLTLIIFKNLQLKCILHYIFGIILIPVGSEGTCLFEIQMYFW